MVDRRTFLTRSETFGLDTPQPWAMDALRLLFCVPRVYAPLAHAWNSRHPGTLRALERLSQTGFVAHQGPVIYDTRNSRVATKPSQRVPRYRVTNRGRQLALAAATDLRELEDRFPRTPTRNVDGVLAILTSLNLEDSHAKFGLSAAHVTQRSRLPASNVKWWLRRLKADGYVRQLDVQIADVREVVPEHWRVTRLLCRQLADVIDAFDEVPDTLKVEFKLRRSGFLTDIDPARVGISGATDFDHDIECQRILAAMLTSPRSAPEAIFTVEPRLSLPLDTTVRPWTFHDTAAGQLFYQPDAEMRELSDTGVRRSVVEYERFQSRRDAWNHIERFLGYLATRTLPFEAAVLRFVVDSRARERSYVALIEAFADYALDHPDRLPGNPVQLAVSSTPRVLDSADPLDDLAWFRVSLPVAQGSDTARRPVLHPAEHSPYEDYFGRR